MDNNAINPKYRHLMEDVDGISQNFMRLVDIVSVLRQECPWDKVQTHKSIRNSVIEEAYEAASAIDKDDFDNLKEELGDLVLQAVFHSQMASENDEFAIEDVLRGISEKLVRRHPHVFLCNEVKSIDKIKEKWENIKSQEHGNVTYFQRLEDVAQALPALSKSFKVQKRAKDAGVDWQDVNKLMSNIKYEIDELTTAIEDSNQKQMQEDLGNLLFSIVNVSRFISVNPEDALNEAIQRFILRFKEIELDMISLNQNIDELGVDDLERLWHIKNNPCKF